MKKLHLLGVGIAAAALAASADAGASTVAAATGADTITGGAGNDTPAEPKAASKAAKAEAEKARYRITADFHDTTTGKLRKKGRIIEATGARAAQLAAAKVIAVDAQGNPDTLDDDAEDEGVDGDGDGADSNLNEPPAIAPVGVDGPVDEAVLHVLGDAAGVTDGDRTLSTDKVPGIVTGGKAKAK
jgi:hypothetical protein